MSYSLFFLFLLILFKFFFCQVSPNYRFFFTLNDNQYNITLADTPWANAFSLFLINKKEITLSFRNTAGYLFFNHNDDFPSLDVSQTQTGGQFNPNSLLECDTQLWLLRTLSNNQKCSLVGYFDKPNYPSDNFISITFKAEMIKTDVIKDDNEDDHDLVVNVLILTSIVSLIILYYLLLLLYA